MLSAEIKIFPGKELLALDMAEIVDASAIGSGIIQGCAFHHQYGALSMDPGRMLIRGRLGYFSGGQIPTTGINVSGAYKVLAVCDLSAATNQFYVDYFDTATGGAYESLVARVNQQSSFNAGDGVAFVEIGTATIDSATGNVTAWTPLNAEPKHDSERLAEAVAKADASHTLLTEKINAWATYLQQRAFAWYPQFKQVTFKVPSFAIDPGKNARPACTFTAIIGTTFRATGPNSRTEYTPASSMPNFEQQYTTLSDGTQVPLNIDNNDMRYVAAAIALVRFDDAAYVSGGKQVGKNSKSCVVAGWGLYGSGFGRKCTIYVKNVGTEQAIVDMQVDLLFVRRG